jgi:hypothetical protein
MASTTNQLSEVELEFLRFKAEQRDFLEKKQRYQGRIEASQREFQFIARLTGDEVEYIIGRKRELAVIKI